MISRRRLTIGQMVVGLIALAAGSAVWILLEKDLGAQAAARVHARIYPGMSYVQLVDLTASETRALALCEELTGLSDAPCRKVRVVVQGDWLASHSFPVTFERGAITSIGSPAYDVW